MARRPRHDSSHARIPADRPSRLAIFLRRQRRLAGPLLALALLGGVAGGGAFLLHRSMSETDFAPIRARLIHALPLRIATITITGRRLTSEASLKEALGTSEGQPIFGFSVEAARARINALPFVDHAVIERHMPDTIVIHLTERSPFAVWQNHGRFTLINRNGDAVSDQTLNGPESEKNAQAFLQLPLIVGDGANTAAATLLDAMAHAPSVQHFVVAAVRVGQRRWNLALSDGAIVELPEGHEPEALARLARYQNDWRLLERPVVSIDMRLPDRMTINPGVRPPTPAEASQPSGKPASPLDALPKPQSHNPPEGDKP